MFYLDKSTYNKKLKKIQKQNESILRKQELEKAKITKNKSKKKKISTTKFVMFYLFFILNLILIYSLIAMWHFEDLTHLGVLITDIIGQVIVFLIYCVKSAKENSKNGIVFETTIRQQSELHYEDDSVLKDT